MKPHDLIKQTYDSAKVSDGFTEHVLTAAKRRQIRRPIRRLAAVLAAVLTLLACVTTGAAASEGFRHWLFSVIEVGRDRESVETNTGDLDLTVDYGEIQEHYGAFFCVGRFLFAEVELRSQEPRPMTDRDLYEIHRQPSDQFVLTYSEPYSDGLLPAEGEGWIRSQIRLDDGGTPGYARYTYCWTLKRSDYDGTTLLVQLWEPLQWEEDANGVLQAVNKESRRLLGEVRVPRRRPEDTRTLWLADGSEVRICAFGVEVQGRSFAAWSFHPAEQDTEQDGILCGAVLADGTRIPFLGDGWRSYAAQTPDELIWSAVPFSSTADPEQVVALYRGEEIVPLRETKP